MPPRDRILISGIPFDLAVGKNGARLFEVGQKVVQPDDPGMKVAEWRIDGHDFNSVEQIGPGQEAGYLGRDYGAGTDGRYLCDTLGPLLNSIDLSVYDLAWSPSIPSTSTFIPGVNLIPGGASVVANATGMATIPGPGATTFGYVIRGTAEVAKVDLSDMTVKRDGEVLTEAPTTILSTLSRNGTREVSVGMPNTAYRVLTTVATPPNTDTWATNTGTQKARVLGLAPDRIVALDQTTNQVLGNVLSGSVTMYAPAWSTVSTLNAFEILQFNGFALDGSLWIVGTSNGPYALDFDTREFTALIDEVDNNNLNGILAHWFPVGVIILLSDGTRQQKNGNGVSIGATIFENNSSPVQGRPQAYAGSTRWLYSTEYNPTTGDTYLIAWKPREAGDQHGHLLSPYVIAKLTTLQSQFLNFIGTVNGLRTNPTLMGGRDGNAFWMTIGRTAREIDDSNYRYAASGITYLTEMRRARGTLNDVEAVEFECAGTMGASQTVTVALSLDGGSYQSFTTLTATGFKRQLAVSAGAPDSNFQGFHRIKPRISYATNSSSACPQLVGTFRLFYRPRALTIRTFTVTLILPANQQGSRTAEELEEALRTLERNGTTFAVQDWDKDTFYARITQPVEVTEQQDRGGGADSARGSQRVATLVMEEVQVTA